MKGRSSGVALWQLALIAAMLLIGVFLVRPERDAKTASPQMQGFSLAWKAPQ